MESVKATSTGFLLGLCFACQGSHASGNVLESPGFFFSKIPGPGKSWKNILENYAFLLVLMENKQK